MRDERKCGRWILLIGTLWGSALQAGEAPGDVQAEVIVTGTYIRGSQPASPVLVFDREDFAAAGAATTEQFLATIPQNFRGGPADNTTNNISNNPFRETNASFATGVNLRGLGSGATLVLIDGKRTAGGGVAEFVDVSLIPLSAVERIEIMTDGASAIYGADAVGGVVNFIMRRDYEGAETTGRYGAPTRGGGEEANASQSLGFSWGSGGVLLSGDYYDQKSLSTLERGFSRNTDTLLDGPRDLVPSHKKLSGYLGAQQDISDAGRLSLSALHSERDTYYRDWTEEGSTDGMAFAVDADATQSAVSLGYVHRLGSRWQADLVGGASRNKQAAHIAISGANVHEFDLLAVEGTLRGDLWNLSSGPVRMAAGASYRSDELESVNFSGSTGLFTAAPVMTSAVRAGFAELLVPLFGTTNHPRVLVSLAGRYEEYSSFGSTFNPKYGLRWQPHQDVAFRATYGTSFKAPTLWQLEDSVAARNISNIVDPVSPTGRTRTIVRSGRNSGLQPQTADTLSAGLDWAPAFLPGFRSELSYFAVDYTDRVTTSTNPNTVQLRDPAWANTVMLRGEIPDAEFDALVVDILTGPGNRVNGCNPPTTTPVCSESPGNIMAIMDRRLTNISGSRTRGLDLNLSQHIDSRLGSWRLGANASHLLENSRRVSSFSPYVSILNRVLNPVDLRIRASLRWSRSGWSVSSFVNYTDNYDNEGGALIGTLSPAEIDSWMTLDLGVSYDGSAQASGWLSGLSVALHGSNVTDEDPPFYDDGSFGLGYDPANANPMGRVLSLTVSKTW